MRLESPVKKSLYLFIHITMIDNNKNDAKYQSYIPIQAMFL